MGGVEGLMAGGMSELMSTRKWAQEMDEVVMNGMGRRGMERMDETDGGGKQLVAADRIEIMG